jgi:hypothetical protein
MRKASAVRTRQTWKEKRRRWGSSSGDVKHLFRQSYFTLGLTASTQESPWHRSISPRGRGSRCHTRDDAATMTVAAFAMSRFADLSNAIALAAIFLDAMQLISTLPTELTLERLPRRMFAAVSCLTWHAGLSPALLLHPSVRQCAASATAHLNRLHCILLASSSPSAFVPFPAAWRISPWKKPRVASADVEGRAVRSRTATCVAWFVQSVTPEEPRGQSLCGYGSPPCC